MTVLSIHGLFPFIGRLAAWWSDRPYEARSPKWPKVRADWLAAFPECEACGCKENVEVHHRVPVSVNPDLELSPANLQTLCEKYGHHLHVGHGGNWRKFNRDSVKDAKIFRDMLQRVRR